MPKVNEQERTKEWAINNKKFSLKTKDGIIYTPEGDVLDVPNGITRYLRDPADKLRCGWDIYYFDKDDKYHHTRTRDCKYNGDYRASLKAAIELYLEKSNHPLLNGKTSQRPIEHSHKQKKLKQPGIRFGKAFIAKRKMNIYFFAITLGKSRKTVYIGVDHTWEANYDEKLLLAEQIHKDMKEKRDRERSFIITQVESCYENGIQTVQQTAGKSKGNVMQNECRIS